MFDACVCCDGHGPIEVELRGTLSVSERVERFDGSETYQVCAYCKEDLRGDHGLDVTKVGP